jgi:hypothetical protein
MSVTYPARSYPARVDARLDPELSRWLWLVKWFLAIPHYIVLAFLWLAFVVLSVGAFFSILFTGRYPRSIFDFNVGVLRWSWRVSYYTYGALGTDRYPPFTLADVPDYPAHFDVEYPEKLSRGLVLVKWWLLAIPHYVIVGLFLGGGAWLTWQTASDRLTWGGGGLITILVLVAAVILAFTGRYPQAMFDLILGLNRWVLRVAAYAGLMRDEYPPFRLDMGGAEGGTMTLPGGTMTPPGGASMFSDASTMSGTDAPAPPTLPYGERFGAPGAERAGVPARRRGWTPLRIVGVVTGSLLALVSVGLLSAGGTALWLDQQRDSAGYVSINTDTFASKGYAIASDRISLEGLGVDWGDASGIVGKVRFEATSTSGAPVFIGVAPASSAATYLDGVAHTTYQDLDANLDNHVDHLGTPPSTAPTNSNIWTAKASGPGTQTLVWEPSNGTWTIVAMNADGSQNVSIKNETSAQLPALPWIATGLLVGGFVFLVGGVLLIVLPIRRVSFA